MSKKILIWFGFLFLIILFLGVVSAQDYCSVEANSADCGEKVANGKVVMYLSESRNAHGELVGQENFFRVLCCNFGGGDTSCGANNKILGLSSATNAHAEVPDITPTPTYTSGVCYDSLNTCRETTDNCGTNEIPVLHLSSGLEQGYTNAHIEPAGLPPDSQKYDSKICCVVEYTAQCVLTSAKWQYPTVMEGSNVKAMVYGTNCDGKTISFEVFRGDDDCDEIGTECTNPSNVVFAAESGGVNGTWTAGPSHDDEYHFVATVDGLSEPVTSDNLLVTENICDEITICADYTTKGESYCNPDPCGVAEASVPIEIDCSDSDRNCECIWYEDECKASYTIDSEIGTCIYTQFTDDNCDDGFLTFNWTGEWTWDDECVGSCQIENRYLEDECGDGQETRECPAQIPLPFFNIYSFIVTLTIIALVYVILILRKEKRKR